MAERGLAAELARLATGHDLGVVQRVHRSRRGFASQSFIIPLVVGLALGATMYFNGLTILAFLEVPLAVGVAFGLVYLGETRDQPGRLWIGVCDNGIIALAGGAQPIVVPWPAIVGVQRGRTELGAAPATVGIQRGWAIVIVGVAAGAPVGISFSAISDRGGLLRSVARSQPQKAPVVRYAVTAGVALAAVAVAIWQIVLPEFVVQDEDVLPATTAELGRACEAAGTRFTTAPAYSGQSPHPIVLFVRDETDSAESYRRVIDNNNTQREWEPQSPSEVQLVACAQRSGSGRYSQSCTYMSLSGRGGIATVGLYQGVYTVEVYELRTHQQLGTFEVTGDRLTCPSSIVDGDDDVYADASLTAYQHALGNLVYRAGGS